MDGWDAPDFFDALEQAKAVREAAAEIIETSRMVQQEAREARAESQRLRNLRRPQSN